MYYLKYKVVGEKTTLIVATTRVETLFSDVAIAINPKDKRFIKLLGKNAINPLTKKKLIIIADSYVQMDKGTGAMKVSAHATADIDIIKKNNLKIIECIDQDGKMNLIAKEYAGLDRFEARKLIVDKLEKAKMVEKIEEISNNVGYSQRSDTVVEILVSPQ
jgi:valyl-tRNA synthetase